MRWVPDYIQKELKQNELWVATRKEIAVIVLPSMVSAGQDENNRKSIAEEWE